jgi:DNA-binding NarL/FixJ family response regulator
LLTDDERAVLDYRRRGLCNAEIAAEMNCSERTVNRLVRAVVDKIRKI